MDRLSTKVKPGQIVATTNVAGYEGQELAVYLGKGMPGTLMLQWLGKNGTPIQVFTEDFDKTFYKTKIIRTDNNEIEFKRKKTK